MKYLRRIKDRSKLYLKQNGRCAHCQCILLRNWHADHIEPLSLGGSCEIDNFQALCSNCNIKKSNKMKYSDYEKLGLCQSSSLNNARSGQIGGINCAIHRLKNGHNTVALSIATGVGKSNIARTLAIELKDQGLSAGTLYTTPSAGLVAQTNDKEEVLSWTKLFRVRPKSKLAFDSCPKKFNSAFLGNNEYWSAMTTQMFNMNIEDIVEAADIIRNRTGKPVCLIGDECQTLSIDKPYGESVTKWLSAGHQVVLMTATPYRTDGTRIPGFNIEQLGFEKRKRNVVRPGQEGEKRLMDIFECLDEHLKLIPDYEYGFDRAWRDNIICKIEFFRIAVKFIDKDGNKKYLSEMAPSEAKKCLCKASRDPAVAEEGCKIFTNCLKLRKQDKPETAGIIFCGNDIDDDVKDEMPQVVYRIIRQIAPELRIKVATSNVEKSVDSIDEFRNGGFDVLITKLMGGIGLDVPRAKVELNLTPIRQSNAFVQMSNRITRNYKGIKHGDLIAIDDPLMTGLYNEWITNNGGNMVTTTSTLVDTVSIESSEKKPTFLMIDEAAFSHVADHDSNICSGDDYNNKVNPLLARFPFLVGAISTSQAMEIAKVVPQDELLTNSSPVEVVNVDEERKKMSDFLNKYVKQAAAGHSDFQDALKVAWSEIRRHAGVRLNKPYNTLTLQELQRMVDYVREKPYKQPIIRNQQII